MQTVSNQVRAAIRKLNGSKTNPVSYADISREIFAKTGGRIDASQIQRFVVEEKEITTKAFDLLCIYLNLKLQ